VSVDTEIQGDTAAIQRAGNWLKEQLAPKVASAADAFNDGRRDAEGSWHGLAGEEFVETMRRGRDASDDLEGATRTMGDDLVEFGEDVKTCQDDMAQIRADARAAGLTVTGFLIEDPGAGPARPPLRYEGPEEGLDDYNDDVAAYNDHQELVRQFTYARSEAERIDRKYATACRGLQDDYTVGTHANWLVTVADIVGETAAASVAASIASRQSALAGRAQSLLAEAQQAIDDLQAHPERYLRRRWLFFQQLDSARLEADRLAIAGRIDEAEDLIRRASALDDARLPRYLGRAGRILGPIGLGLGIYNDYQEGESVTQIAVSQGVSFGAGVAAGAGVGALIGSVVPGPGTAIGAGVGAIVGAGVSIFSDGMIDSFFENGPDVGEALSEGVDALADTGEAIADGVGGAISTVGGWFS
jgi:uncharacterized protein YukE